MFTYKVLRLVSPLNEPAVSEVSLLLLRFLETKPRLNTCSVCRITVEYQSLTWSSPVSVIYCTLEVCHIGCTLSRVGNGHEHTLPHATSAKFTTNVRSMLAVVGIISAQVISFLSKKRRRNCQLGQTKILCLGFITQWSDRKNRRSNAGKVAFFLGFLENRTFFYQKRRGMCCLKLRHMQFS